MDRQANPIDWDKLLDDWNKVVADPNYYNPDSVLVVKPSEDTCAFCNKQGDGWICDNCGERADRTWEDR